MKIQRQADTFPYRTAAPRRNEGDTVHRLVQDKYLDVGKVLDRGPHGATVEWTTDDGTITHEFHTPEELDEMYPWGN